MSEANTKLKCLLAQRTNCALHLLRNLRDGVLAFECLRNSACVAFVHATFVRFAFFAILFSAFSFRFRHCSLCSYVRHGGVWRSIYICKTPFSSLNASSQSHGVCEMVVERSTMTVISTSASANAWQTSSDLPRPHCRLLARRSVGVQEICRVASTVHHQRYVDAAVRDGPTATQRDRATAITVEVEASLNSAAECR